MLEIKKVSKYKTYHLSNGSFIQTPIDEFFNTYSDESVIEFTSKGEIARIGTWCKLRRTYFFVFEQPEYYK